MPYFNKIVKIVSYLHFIYLSNRLSSEAPYVEASSLGRAYSGRNVVEATTDTEASVHTSVLDPSVHLTMCALKRREKQEEEKEVHRLIS